MKKFVPFLLILTVLSSGCTIPILNIEIPGLPDIPGLGGPTVVQYEHDIIVIKSLEAIPSEIDAGQTTKIIAYIQNVGDKTVGEGDLGADDDVEIELYDYCQGLFKVKDINCRGTPDQTKKTKCTIDKMLPGEIVPVVWTLEQEENNPVSLRTICPPDGMKVSVGYKYSTTALTTISFISQAELERSLEQREYKSTESYIVVGQGPIKPYLTVEDKQPIPVYEEGARTVLGLQIKNMGSGQLASKVTVTVDNKPEEQVAIPKGKITVTGLKEGGELDPEDDCSFKDGSPKDDVRLMGKDSSKMLCKVDLSKLGGSVVRTATRHIEVSVEYDYLFTKAVTVVINPKVAE
jgi:archaellum component FlaG (FlaF/FlaG flagellin family)